MNVLALDLATTTGWAYGPAGGRPESGSVLLRKPSRRRKDTKIEAEPYGVGAFNLLAFLRDKFAFWQPDRIVIENFLHPTAQPGGGAVILSLMLHGAAEAFARSYGIEPRLVAPATWRLHFIGKANAGDRDATKAAVIRRAQMLGYVPRDCYDDNRADACGIWDYGCAVFSPKAHGPSSLNLFGG
jgi:hypothetical protein